MYKHPMLSVKEAAAMLGCDERWIRERLNQGQLKGEKKTIGMKEKWFVYKGEIDAALARKGVSSVSTGEQTNFDPPITDAVVNAESVEAESNDEAPSKDWEIMQREFARIMAEEMVKPLIETIQQQSLAIEERERVIGDQERQLRLLPDLEKKEETARQEAQIKELEVEALNKQIGAMQDEKLQLNKDLEAMKATIEDLQKPWWKKLF